jgi:hypothetical protein
VNSKICENHHEISPYHSCWVFVLAKYSSCTFVTLETWLGSESNHQSTNTCMWGCISGSDHLRTSASFLAKCPLVSRFARRSKANKLLPFLGVELWQYSYYFFALVAEIPVSSLFLRQTESIIYSMFFVLCIATQLYNVH